MDKVIITKEDLIGIILDKCEDDFVSTTDLLKIIDKVSDEHGNISKKRLIKSIRNSHTKAVIKEVFNSLEDSLFDSLSETNKKTDVCIKLFEGINLNGTYVSGKSKRNNLTGQVNFVDSKIKPKFYITRSYCEKLNSQ